MIGLPEKKTPKPYQPYGAALKMWKSSRREVVLAGPAGTGKTRANLQKLHYCATKYPGMRGLIVRKTRESLNQTALVTYESKVLPPGWLDIIHFNTQEQQYEYPNGSIIALGGLDKASKIMSSEWDMIVVLEATELTEDDWEALTTRLRNGVMPYQQLIGDCNPGPPTHWLKQRADRGATLMLESRHDDNPSVTKAYIATLDALTGVRKLRLRYGKWAAAEGMVYETWDAALHIVSEKQLIEWGVLHPNGTVNLAFIRTFVASVDWGYKNPGVILVFGIDSEDRAYLLRQIYRTQRDIDWWIAQAKQLTYEFRIEQFLCDPSQPAYIAQFNAQGMNAVGAINDIAPGISAVQSCLNVDYSGRPRLCVYENSLKERDELRDAVHKTYCLEQEIDAYVWPQDKAGQALKEVPVKVDDHALDALRYFCMSLSQDNELETLDLDLVNELMNFRGY